MRRLPFRRSFPLPAYQFGIGFAFEPDQLRQGQPPARKSVWMGPEAAKISPAYARIAAWMSDGVNKGPFPMPYNLRFTELENMYEKQSPPVWQGTVALQGGLQQMQSLADAIMAEPRS